jgi:hypothetical protein
MTTLELIAHLLLTAFESVVSHVTCRDMLNLLTLLAVLHVIRTRPIAASATLREQLYGFGMLITSTLLAGGLLYLYALATRVVAP